MSACERRVLEDAGPISKIVIETRVGDIANITCDRYNDKIPVKDVEPEVMRVLFYHHMEDRLLADVFVQNKVKGPSGEVRFEGEAPIYPGNYRMIVYSFGAETTYIENYDSFENSYAYCDPVPVPSKDQDDVMEQPDHIFVGSKEENVPVHQGDNLISIAASTIVESYYLQFYVEGLEHVSSAAAVISSMSGSVKLSTREAEQVNPVSVYIPLIGSEDDGKDVLCAVFNTFGRVPDGEVSLSVNIIRTDGVAFRETYDISSLFRTEECLGHRWLLMNKTIVIPEPADAGDGYDPVINDWEDVESDVEI